MNPEAQAVIGLLLHGGALVAVWVLAYLTGRNVERRRVRRIIDRAVERAASE